MTLSRGLSESDLTSGEEEEGEGVSLRMGTREDSMVGLSVVRILDTAMRLGGEVPRESPPVSILKGGKLSRDNSKDRAAMSDSDDLQPGKPLSRTGSLKKSSSFSKKGFLTEKKKISFDDDVDLDKFKSSEAEQGPISQAKQIFAAIADTTLEAGTSGLRQRSKERPGDFTRTEPAEWDPEEDPDNEDELMIILDDNELLGQKSESLKSRSESRSGDRSTGFSHLDEFEKRLAEMQDDLETESKHEPIYATIP